MVSRFLCIRLLYKEIRNLQLQITNNDSSIVMRSRSNNVLLLQGLLDCGEAKTAAQLSRGTSFVQGTRRPVRGSRLPGRS